MADSLDLSAEIHNEFKRTTLAFLRQLERITPQEMPYALLFEISDQNPGAWPIAATEESLSRLAAKYIAKGYKGRNGNDLELLRGGLRWDAPGDDMTGWYWGDDSIHEGLNKVLTRAFQHGYADDDNNYNLVKRICLRALDELDREGAFGVAQDRERLVVGISNVDIEFENVLHELSAVNPQSVVERLHAQIKQSNSLWDEIDRP